MSEVEMVPMIVLFTMAGVVAMTWIKSKEKSALHGVSSNETDKRIKKLEERVAVLERLATDKPGKLSAEIEAL